MTTPAGPSGAIPSASGTSGDSGDSDSQNPSGKVDYETHRKLLGEKKRLAEQHAATQAELDKFRKAEEDRQVKEAEAAKDYEKLKQQFADQLKAKESELAQHAVERTQAVKLDAFFAALDGKLERKYWGLIDVDAIIIDPSTKAPDQMSVTTYLEKFRKEYPEVIAKPGRSSMPNDKPLGSSSGSLSYEEWLALPLKDKKLRQKDVKLS